MPTDEESSSIHFKKIINLVAQPLKCLGPVYDRPGFDSRPSVPDGGGDGYQPSVDDYGPVAVGADVPRHLLAPPFHLRHLFH